MAYCCLELPSAVFELVLTRYRYWSIFGTYSTPPTSLVWLPLSLMALQAPWPQKACDSRAESCLLRLRRIDYCEYPSCFYLRILQSGASASLCLSSSHWWAFCAKPYLRRPSQPVSFSSTEAGPCSAWPKRIHPQGPQAPSQLWSPQPSYSPQRFGPQPLEPGIVESLRRFYTEL